MRLLRLFALTAIVLVLGASAARADDASPLSRAELDRRAAKTAYDIVDLGTQLFNGGNQDACYRLYEGALWALVPNLDHRPDVMRTVKDRLEKARTLRTVSERAFALREGLDAVMSLGGMKKPLWERLGGEGAVRAVIHDFVAAAAPDPKVNFLRNGKFKLDADGVKHLEQLLVELVSAVTGGPLKYSGRDMKSSHAGMRITDAEFDALAGHLIATLNKYKVPQVEIDELVGIVGTTRKDIVEVGKKPLWDRLGGEAGVRAVTKEFIANAAEDPKANLDRNGNYPLTRERGERVEQLVVEFLSSATGGPLKYTGRDMKNSHQGMKITEDEFNAAAVHLVGALKKFNVPQTEIDELVGLVGGVAKDIVEVKKK